MEILFHTNDHELITPCSIPDDLLFTRILMILKIATPLSGYTQTIASPRSDQRSHLEDLYNPCETYSSVIRPLYSLLKSQKVPESHPAAPSGAAQSTISWSLMVRMRYL